MNFTASSLDRNVHWLITGLLVSIAALYSQVLQFAYVWDDVHLFVASNRFRGGMSWLQAVTEPFFPGTVYFRPLVLASFIAEFRWFGVSASTSHLINLVFHLINVGLTFWLAHVVFARSQLSLPALRAWMATALYAIHPALIEPIAWVSSRFDLMATSFALLGLTLAVLGRQPSLWLIFGSAVSFLAAAMCKESVVLLPLALAVLRHLLDTPTAATASSLRGRIGALLDPVVLAWIAAGVIYLALRFRLMSTSLGTDPRIGFEQILDGSHLALVGETVALYARLIFIPFTDLSVFYPLDVFELSPLDRAAGISKLVVALAVVVAVWRTRTLAGRLFAVGAIVLLPVLNLLPLRTGGSLGHTRFLVLPLTMMVMSLTAIDIKNRLGPSVQGRILLRAWPWLFGLWCVAALLTVFSTVPLWRNSLTLWAWQYQKHPNVPNVQRNYLDALISFRQFARGLEVVREIERSPVSPPVDVLIGLLHVRTGNPQRAITLIESALNTLPRAHLVLQHQYGVEVKPAKIQGHGTFDSMLLTLAYSVLSDAYSSIRHFDRALESAEIALFYQPGLPNAHLAKAFALWGLDRPQEAEAAFNAARAIWDSGASDAVDDLREQFLRQLCYVSVRPRTSCAGR
jgi:hypothetical protein